MFSITILILGTAMAGMVKASEPVVRIEPKSKKADPGETFNVNITVTDIVIGGGLPPCQGLYGWEASIKFNPKVLNAVNATEGPFLQASGYETLWRSRIDNTGGNISIGAMIFEIPVPPNGTTGSGVLATITFEVMSRGTTSIHFQRAKLFTVISNVRAPIEPFTIEDGAFDNRTFVLSTELIGAIVVVVVIVCGVAVFFYRRRRATARV